ncbi:EI24 domain-containing protein [Cyclobacteriaceae bacterium]|nr:EI24 domain-containing protein [Cyclobacteriaceae bacterium]
MFKRFTGDFFLGIRSFIRAFFFLFDHNLWLYFVVPVVLFIAMYLSADFIHKDLLTYDFKGQLEQIDFQKELRDFSWFKGFPTDSKEVELIFVSVKVIFIVGVLRMKRYLILILMSPLLAFISSKIEYILVDNKYAWDTQQFVKDIYRGANFALRNMFRQALILAGWYLLVAVFGDLDRFSLVISFTVGAYYYGASLMDYTNERRRMNMQESITYIRKRAGITMAVGLIFYGMFFIEFVGFIIAPITGVVAATLAIHAREDLSGNQYAIRDKAGNKTKTPKPQKEADPWANG